MISRTEDNFRHNRSSGFGKEFIILLSHFHSRNPFIENWTKLSNWQKLLDEICGNSKIQNIMSYKHISIFKRWSWWDDCFKTEILLWKYALWKENKTGRNTWPGFPGGSEVKASASNVGNLGLIPGLGRSPAEGNGNPLQYSCLENPMDGEAWWATVHGSQRVGHDWVTSLPLSFPPDQVKIMTACSIYLYLNNTKK